MSIAIKVPRTGESITEVQIGEWLKNEGDSVKRDEPVVVIETDKASMELPAPATGTLTQVAKKPGDLAQVGETIAYIEESQQPASQKAEPPAEQPKKDEEQPRTQPARDAATKPKASPERPKPTESVEQRPQPPVPRPAKKETESRDQQGSQSSTLAPGPQSPAPSSERSPDEITPMSMLRRRIAERLVEAQHQAALLTTFNEIDMSAVLRMRRDCKDAFKERYGTDLGFMSFFVKATVAALKRFPQLNSEVQGTNIVRHHYYDMGVAVSTERGLVVPVLRDADKMSFAQIEGTIADLARRARENQLKVEELQGGTFTITNGGVFGSMLSTPIINPPQSGILGLHAIQDRPVARDGNVVIRPMMYIALTYDHRIVDGKEAVTFLRHIKELVEDPTRMLIEV